MASLPFRTKFIVNPKAGNGRASWEWGNVKQAIEQTHGKIEFDMTSGPNMASLLTRRAIEDHYQLVVAVGGDGTINEVINGFFEHDAPVNREAVLGIIPLGTGSDFVRSLGYPQEWQQVILKLADTNAAVMDVGRFKCTGARGDAIDRYFGNIADFGLGGETVAKVKNQPKMFGAKVQFFLGAAKSLMGYKNKKVTFRLDDGPETTQWLNSLVIANGQFFGAGMWVAPYAKLDDGKFDVVIIDQMSQVECFKKMKLLYTGEHVNDPVVKYTQAQRVWADSKDEVLVDIDGEQLGRLPATWEIVPQAIRVKV